MTADVSNIPFNEITREWLIEQVTNQATIEMVTINDLDLTEADFSGGVFQKVTFYDSQTRGINFQDAVLENAVLNGIDMSGCDFSRAKFTDCIFSNVNLSRASFVDATIDGCTF
ncbi:MAG: hypothetical protein GF372_10470, partial [Candidatus Marinimicrobia bacterium]|nr:hypothetical protein [Candidatus Neomarinimicrobiota bacterium]